ncbi:MAG: lamin tail domain-containing protein [Cytophagales bacterium]|nr:lamin tail domain-containing protein [Cytophagales bacterium]
MRLGSVSKYFVFSIVLIIVLTANDLFAQQKNSLIITEIFADPTPSHGLPEKEFIELYNNSQDVIELNDYTLFYASSEVQLPEYELKPQEYIIACRFNNAEFYEPYGNVLALEKFSLLNSGTTLKLIGSDGYEVFSVTYSSDWYSPNRDQGYSLEMVDLNYPCSGFGNWTSSLAEEGGTPGRENASKGSNPDLSAPEFISYSSENNLDFTFVFSENIEEGFSVTSDSAITFDKIEVSTLNRNEVQITLSQTLSENSFLTLNFTDISDCSGNSTDLVSVEIGNVSFPKIGEVLLSEILFNPISGGADFVEVYNVSDHLLNIGNLLLARSNTLGEIDSPKPISTSAVLLEPGEVVCLTEDKLVQKELYPKADLNHIVEVLSMPTYSNESGEVILTNINGEIYDRFYYEENMHHPSIDKPDGVSLERINFLDLTNNAIKWLSSSFSENYATPGYRLQRNELSQNEFTVAAEAPFFTPNGDGFNETVGIEFATQYAGNLSSVIYDSNGSLIRKIASNEYLSGTYTFNWDGLDQSGKPVLTGYYLVHAQLRTNDLITERIIKILNVSE